MSKFRQSLMLWFVMLAGANFVCLIAVVALEPAGFDLCDHFASPASQRAQWVAVGVFVVVATGVTLWMSAGLKWLRLSLAAYNAVLWLGLMHFLTTGQNC